jgi:hypothetical protein
MKLLNTLKTRLDEIKVITNEIETKAETLKVNHATVTKENIQQFLTENGFTSYTIDGIGDVNIEFNYDAEDYDSRDVITFNISYPSKWNEKHVVTLSTGIDHKWDKPGQTKSINFGSMSITESQLGTSEYFYLLSALNKAINSKESNWVDGIITRREEIIAQSKETYSNIQIEKNNIIKKISFIEKMLDLFYTLLPKKGQLTKMEKYDVNNLYNLIPSADWKRDITKPQQVMAILKFAEELTHQTITPDNKAITNSDLNLA